MNTIRVLEIIPSCQRGGVPTVVYDLISNLDKRRFEIHLVATNDGPFYQKFARLCPVYDIPIRGYYPLTVHRVRRLIKANDIDIVHAHGKGAALYGRVASLGLSSKTVYTFHGFDCDHYGQLFRHVYVTVEKLLAIITDQIIAVSKGEKNQAEKAGIPMQGRSTVIPNGIGMSGRDSRRRKGHVLGTLSRACPQKGLEFLIQAVAILSGRYRDLTCHIAGGTPKGEEGYEASLRNMARVLGVEDRVVFLGEIDDVYAFFSRIDVYVSTSRWEGLPTAILEAFAAKTPVVATDVVGNRDLVSNLETGVLVRADDSKAIAKGIEFAFENRDRIEALAERAHRLVAERYSIDNMVRQHEELYENLAGFGADGTPLDREERDMAKEAVPQP